MFPNQGSNPGFPHCRWILYGLSHHGSPRILQLILSPVLPDPGIKPGFPALQADSLPAELPGKPKILPRKSKSLAPPNFLVHWNYRVFRSSGDRQHVLNKHTSIYAISCSICGPFHFSPNLCPIKSQSQCCYFYLTILCHGKLSTLIPKLPETNHSQAEPCELGLLL